jgi:hypothetical protein
MPRITPYRTLVVVYAIATLVGICEFLRWPINVNADPDMYGAPAPNYPETMARLYHRRALTEYLLGRRFEALATRHFNREELQRNPELLQKFLSDLIVELQSAARYYENALAAGLKSEEDLHYNYALTLIRIGADHSRIDRAIATWRYHFPHSDHPDLERRRQAIERERRQLLPEAASRMERDNLRLERRAIER